MPKGLKIVGADEQGQLWSIAAGRKYTFKPMQESELSQICATGFPTEYKIDEDTIPAKGCGPLTVLELGLNGILTAISLSRALGGLIFLCEYDLSKDRYLWHHAYSDYRKHRDLYPGTTYARRVRLLPPEPKNKCGAFCPGCGMRFVATMPDHFECNGTSVYVDWCETCQFVGVYQ